MLNIYHFYAMQQTITTVYIIYMDCTHIYYVILPNLNKNLDICKI